MAKYAPEFAVAFAPEDGSGNFNAALETAVETSDNVDNSHGLILGAAGAGQFDSGIDLTVDRVFTDKGRIGGSFTRPISTFIALEASTFTFATDMVGNRITGIITDGGDLKPDVGLDALLGSCYLRGANGSGNTYEYKSGISGNVANPISGYVWAQGERLKFKGARSTLALAQTPQEIGQAVFTISIGEVLDFVTSGLPTTLSYGLQAQVGAEAIRGVGNQWGVSRGWSDCTFNVAATIDDIPDSNAATGVVKEPSDLEVTLDVTLYKDDSAPGYEAAELQRSSTTEAPAQTPKAWDAFGWLVGAAASGTTPRLGYSVNFPTPELQSEQPAPQGVSSASTLSLIGRAETAGEEFVLSFV